MISFLRHTCTMCTYFLQADTNLNFEQSCGKYRCYSGCSEREANIDCFCEMLVIFDLLKYMILFHGKVSLLLPSTIKLIIVAGVHNNLTVLQRRVVR